jgi:hypothetical protein
MEGPNRKRWEELSRQAAVEKDPKKLLELAAEINRLLQEKEKRLQQQRQARTETNLPKAHLVSPCRKATAIRCARLSAPSFWHARYA